MNVTIIGTGNMARGIGTRLIAGGHDVTVLGKDTWPQRPWSPMSAQMEGEAGRSGDPIADDVVVLAVYYPDAQTAVEQYGDVCRARSSSTSRTRSTRPSTGSSRRQTAPRPRSSPASSPARASSRPSTRPSQGR